MKEVENKFIVINIKDLEHLTEEGKEKLYTIIYAIENARKMHNKKINNYWVCNQDEPYAEQVKNLILSDGEASQLEPLVMQLAAFIHFLCQYHEDAKESRNKIALAPTLKEARETAMFDYPVAQGIEFNMDIYKIAQSKLGLNKNGNIQKAIEYMLKLSSQSA